jgi:ribosome-binding factor A
VRIRPERVAERMKREIAGILTHELSDPRLSSLVSVTEVEVTHDLSFARVFVSVLAGEAERERELATLQRAAGFIRRQLAPRLGLREVPELRFAHDASIERGARVEEILKRIERGEPAPDEEEGEA